MSLMLHPFVGVLVRDPSCNISSFRVFCAVGCIVFRPGTDCLALGDCNGGCCSAVVMSFGFTGVDDDCCVVWSMMVVLLVVLSKSSKSKVGFSIL